MLESSHVTEEAIGRRHHPKRGGAARGRMGGALVVWRWGVLMEKDCR